MQICQLHSLHLNKVCIQQDCKQKGPICDQCTSHDKHIIKDLTQYILDLDKQDDVQQEILNKLEAIKVNTCEQLKKMQIDINSIDDRRRRVLIKELLLEKMNVIVFQSKVTELIHRDQIFDYEYFVMYKIQLLRIENQIRDLFNTLPKRQHQQEIQQTTPQSPVQTQRSKKEGIFTPRENITNNSLSPFRKQLKQRDLSPVGAFHSKVKNYFTEQQESKTNSQIFQKNQKSIDRSIDQSFEKYKETSKQIENTKSKTINIQNDPYTYNPNYRSEAPGFTTFDKEQSQQDPKKSDLFFYDFNQSKQVNSIDINQQSQSIGQPTQQVQRQKSNNQSIEKSQTQNNFDKPQDYQLTYQQQTYQQQTYQQQEPYTSPFEKSEIQQNNLRESVPQTIQTIKQNLDESMKKSQASFINADQSYISSRSVAPQVKKTPNLPNPFIVTRKTWKAHDKSVKDLLIMENDNLVSCSRDKQIIIWDRYVNQYHRKTFQSKLILKGHQDQVYSIDYKKINKIKYLISGSQDKNVKIWKADPSWKEYKTLIGHNDRIRAVCFVSDLIASGSDDTHIKIWNINGDLLQTQKVYGRVCALISQEDNLIIGSGRTISIYNVSEFKEKLQVQGHSNLVLCLFLLSKQGNNRSVLFSGSRDCQVKLWDYPTLKLMTTIQEDYPIGSICVDLQTQTMALGLCGAQGEGKISLWHIGNDEKVQEIVDNPYGCNKLCFCEGNLYSAHENKRIEFWNL
ncbi:hypothetical protein pb186bvf_004212 [Paramecium bursaria]